MELELILELIHRSFVNKIDFQVSRLDVKTFVFHVKAAMTSLSSPGLFWWLHVFLVWVLVEKLIVGSYRIRRAKAVSFECQSLIWVFEVYPSVIRCSLMVCIIALTQKRDRLQGLGPLSFMWAMKVWGKETPFTMSTCRVATSAWSSKHSWIEHFFSIQVLYEQVKASRLWLEHLLTWWRKISNLQLMQQKSDG